MKKYIMRFFLILILALFAGCVSTSNGNNSQSSLDQDLDNLANQFINTLAQDKKKTLAIIDFVTLDGQPTMLGKYIQEELTIRIFRSGKISIVERSLLDKVMEEWNLGATGYINEETAAKIGQVLGVETIAIGSLTDLGTTVKVNARIINVETGTLLSVASISLTKDATIKALLAQTPNDTKKQSISDSRSASDTVVKKHENSITTDQGVQFTFDSAVYDESDNRLRIYGTVMPLEGDIKLGFASQKLKIITDSGDSYIPYKIIIGTQRSMTQFTDYVTIIENVQTKMEIEVKMETKPGKILRIQLIDDWYGEKPFKFNLKSNLTVK
jgi:TolB-like protein